MTTKPDPDPTVLTTQQLLATVEGLRELLEARLHGFEVRFDDRAKQVDEALSRLPGDVQSQVAAARAVHEEKFNSVQTQFKERDTRTEQMAAEGKLAINAALQAAKEAVQEQNRSAGVSITKSEDATMKSIDQLRTLLQTTTAGLDGKISDIKDRLTMIEGRGSGFSTSWAIVVAVLGFIVGLGGLVLAIVKVRV